MLVHYKSEIGKGNREVVYVCPFCQSKRSIRFDYSVIHQITEHERQGVDGCVTESVKIKHHVPEIIQCGHCDYVSMMKMNETIFDDSRDSLMNFRRDEVIKKADMSLRYPVHQLERDIEKVFSTVVVEPVGQPFKA